MIHLDLKTSNKKHNLNLQFNNVFKVTIERGLEVLSGFKTMAAQEYGWLNKAQENVLAELMSWKNKTK